MKLDVCGGCNAKIGAGSLDKILKNLDIFKRDDILIGFDGNDDAKNAIEAGTMKATIAQQPDEIGALGVELAAKIYNGEKVDKNIAADLKIYTNEN